MRLFVEAPSLVKIQFLYRRLTSWVLRLARLTILSSRRCKHFNSDFHPVRYSQHSFCRIREKTWFFFKNGYRRGLLTRALPIMGRNTTTTIVVLTVRLALFCSCAAAPMEVNLQESRLPPRPYRRRLELGGNAHETLVTWGLSWEKWQAVPTASP